MSIDTRPARRPDVPALARVLATDRALDRHAALARRLLSDPANTSGRFFAWFHFMDPHDQYQGHPGVTPWGRRTRDRYDGEVTYTDAQLRDFVTWIQQQPWGADS